MKKMIATILIAFLICTSTLLVADTEDSTYIPAPSKGMFLTTTFGSVTTGLGIGYRNNRFEVGSTISSAAIHVGTACLPLGHPIIGLIGGAMAFGGLDAYVRYDLLPSPKYNLSAGIGGNEMKPDNVVWRITKHRCHRRNLHREVPGKGGIRQSRRPLYKVQGFHLHDKALIYETGQIGYITGLRSSGKFQISDLQNKSIGDRSCSKLKLLEHSGGIRLVPSASSIF